MRYRFPYVGADVGYLAHSQTPAYTLPDHVYWPSRDVPACLLSQLS